MPSEVILRVTTGGKTFEIVKFVCMNTATDPFSTCGAKKINDWKI